MESNINPQDAGNFISVNEFLDSYNSPSTKQAYKRSIEYFFEIVGTNPEKYFGNGRNYRRDVTKFYSVINDKPPKSVHLYLSVVRSYLEENEIDLPNRFWKKLRNRTRGKKAVTDDKAFAREPLQDFLSHMNDVKGRAFFMMMATSGMRMGELLHLKFNDIELDSDPVKIRIKASYTKGNSKRITFITEEAKAELLRYLDIRNEWLKSTIKKTNHPRKITIYEGMGENKKKTTRLITPNKTIDDEHLFPITRVNARAWFTNALKKAGLNMKDETTNRYVLHSHSLRKFFNDEMGKFSEKYTHILMGHEGYLSEYDRVTEKELEQFYKERSSCLAIFSELEKNIPKIQSQDTAIASLVHQNKEFEKMNDHLSSHVKYLEHQMEDMTHARETEIKDAEIQAKLDKEHTKEFAKEHPDEFAEVLKYVKALQKLGLKVV